VNCGKHHLNIRNGTTVVELTFVVILTTIVLSVVYFTWRHINAHIATQQNKAKLESECKRISQQVTHQLRSTEEIITWNTNSITFTMSPSFDTISYLLNGSELEYNGKPLPFLLHNVEVSDFSFDNLNRDDESKPYLFNFTITLTTRGLTATVTSTIMVKRPYGQESDRDFIW
jgi:Tfp pilus assembly protein PilE